MLTVSEQWRQAYPGASAGVLAIHDVTNPRQHAGLDQRKTALEAQLRARYAGYDRAALKALPADALNDVTLVAYHKWDNTRRFVERLDPDWQALITTGAGMKSWNPWRRLSNRIQRYPRKRMAEIT